MTAETIRENSGATVRENDSNTIVRERSDSGNSEPSTTADTYFRDYKIIRELPTKSTEADIFVVSKDSTEYILKKYRKGFDPKQEILQAIKVLSENYPDNFIRVFESAFDTNSERYYEIQEYAQKGTLSDVIESSKSYTDMGRATLFTNVARQVGEALYNLHENNLLHLDIKPSNILLRSKKPLKMVLTDFGIATSLDSDMSKKATAIRGTPMYQSPESYSGVMRRATDWWGLGMILLEIANKAHPFSNLSANVISDAIITKPIDIPENIDNGQRELIRGLLTHNPEKRWDWEQVSRWMNGERGIPQYFDSDASIASIAPFKFMGQQYYTPTELASVFVQSEDSWLKGRAALMRGEIASWARNTKQIDLYAYIMEDLSSIQDADEKMLQFIQHFGEKLPFVFLGHLISLKNLLLFLGKILNREKMTEAEEAIVNSIPNGVLLRHLASYIQANDTSDEMEAIQKVLKELLGKSFADITLALDFYSRQQDFYCPFFEKKLTPEELIKQVSFFDVISKLKMPPKRQKEWDSLNELYILPNEIIRETFSTGTYAQAMAKIEELRQQNLLLFRDGRYTDKKEALASAPLNEYLNVMNVLDFYLNPESYYAPFLKKDLALEALVKEIARFASLKQNIKSLKEWDSLNERYILPQAVVKETFSIGTYGQAITKIAELEQKKILLLRNGRDIDKKENLASASLNEYLNGVYALQFGYNAVKVREAFNKFTNERTKATGLRKAELELWIEYLQLVMDESFELTDQDIKILKKVSIGNTEAVQSRINDLVKENPAAMSAKFWADNYSREVATIRRKRILRIISAPILAIVLAIVGAVFVSLHSPIWYVLLSLFTDNVSFWGIVKVLAIIGASFGFAIGFGIGFNSGDELFNAIKDKNE